MLMRSSRAALAAVIFLAGSTTWSGRVPAAAPEDSLFRLHTSTGHLFSRQDLPPDALVVIYFGFSTCWRYCPLAMNNIATVIDSLGPQAARVRPVFVDMDPARTTRQQLTRYLKSYGPRFVGLTGSSSALRKTVSSFGVSVQKQQFSNDPMDYAMTHTSPIIIWDLRSGIRTQLPSNSQPADIIAALRESGRNTKPESAPTIDAPIT